jgi:hypothetical protein
LLNMAKRTFIHDIPLGALSAVPPSENLDVIFHDLDERLIVELALSHPSRELTVPYQVVAAKLQVVLLRILDVSVTVLKGKVSAIGLG